MAKTHTLKVVSSGNVIEREVGGRETLVWAENGDLRSWPVKAIDVLTIKPSLDGEGMVLTVSVEGRADIHRIAHGARVEIGNERWPVNTLASFELLPIPTPEPAPELPSRVWRIVRMDGTEQVVELESARVAGSIAGTVDDGFAGREWGAMLSDVATIERVES